MKTTILALAWMLAAAGAQAADKGHHADPKRGGVTAEAGPYHLELVIKDKALFVHVDDHDGKAVDVAKWKALANVFSGKDKAAVELAPSGANVLRGEAAFPIAANAKVVLSLTPSSGKPVQARLQLGAKPDHKGHKH